MMDERHRSVVPSAGYRRLGVQNRRELASLAQRRNGELTRWETERPAAPTVGR